MPSRPPRQLEALRAGREAFLAGTPQPDGIRPQILASWRRSAQSGVDCDHPVMPYLADFEPQTSKLYLAARPVLERCAERMAGSRASIVLADRRARVLARWSGDRALDRSLEQASVGQGFLLTEGVAGTNGIGTALKEDSPVEIVGSEHFAGPFCNFTCVGSPIRHPMTGQIEGVLDIAYWQADPRRSLLPVALEAAAEIERELYLHASEREQALLRSFLQQARRTARPVVSMSEQVMMANAAAARLLDGADQVVLWEQASQAAAGRRSRSVVLSLADGREVRAHCQPVELDARTIGVLVELEPGDLEASGGPHPASTSGDGPLVGQASAWRQAEALTRRVAASGLPVLFLGEPGTGKMALAALAHAQSGAAGDLTILDAALADVSGPAGWLAEARLRLSVPGGSTVVRHAERLGPEVVPGLCALIDSIGGSAGRLLATAVTTSPADPGLPQPLLDRLAVVRVPVPPLRHRAEDIGLLAGALIRRHARRRPLPRLRPEALQALVRLDWPGNVRQLENVIRGLVSGGRLADIRLADLPEDVRRRTTRRPLSRLEQVELDQILAGLREAGGNKLRAAQALGISRSTLYRKLGAFGVDPDRPSG